MHRVRLWPAIILLACASPDDEPVEEGGCTPFADIQILELDGREDPSDVEWLRTAMGEFETWTGRSCLNLDTVEVVADILTNDEGLNPAADHSASRRRIRVERRYVLTKSIRHELCHALDRLESLSDDNPDIWAPEAYEIPERYAEDQWLTETFARACETGPAPLLDRALRATYGLRAMPRVQFLHDEVWVQAPQAPELLLDLHLEPKVEHWAHGAEDAQVEVHRNVGDRIAVLLRTFGPDTEHGDLSLHVLSMDPLREERAIPLQPFGADAEWYPYELWAGQDRVWIGAGTDRPSVRVELDGEVEVTTVTPSAQGPGVVLDGLAVALDLDRGIVAIDLHDGSSESAGLHPSASFIESWVQDGQMALGDGFGHFLGHPDTGWMHVAATAPGRTIPLSDGSWLGYDSVSTEDGYLYMPVATDAQGVHHYSPVPMESWGAATPVDDRWRTVSMTADGVRVVTVEP